jgi:hypothetical protein
MQCNGDWEHSYGIDIKTTDNPGWTISIDIEDTELEREEFLSVRIPGPDTDYLFAEIEQKKFSGACSLHRLEELLRLFVQWSERSASA